MSPMCAVSVASVSLTPRRPHPVIVVEVLSPSSGNLDKITDYFASATFTHYLIIDLGRRPTLSQAADGAIAVAIVRDGGVFGITVAVADPFG